MIVNKTELEQKILPAVPSLKEYWNLLCRWQKTVNLVSSKTIENGWDRHILDSAQVYFLMPKQAKFMMDVGSGGGLPAIVIAILNKELNGSLKRIMLVESDMKKCLFLKECARLLKLDIEVMRDRIENVNEKPDVITARAFAPLSELLSVVKKNVSRETILLLPKGKNVESEMQQYPRTDIFVKIKNIIDSNGCILKVEGRDL